MPWFFGLIALLAGSALAVQVGVNNGLKAKLGQPIAASALSFATGTLALALYWIATRAPLPAPDRWRGGPWWAWLGGTLGAIYIVLTVTFSPRMGAAGWVGVVVAGQILTSVALDHFGLVGFAQHFDLLASGRRRRPPPRRRGAGAPVVNRGEAGTEAINIRPLIGPDSGSSRLR